MSPSMPGEHYFVKCSECGFSFTCDIEQAQRRQDLICSNCGGKTDSKFCQQKAAASVEILDSNFPIQRWDVIAFRRPVNSDQNDHQPAGIKRVVGLPGESIEIRGGNLFANGSIVQKNIEQQKMLRIPVHDTSFQQDLNRNWVSSTGLGWHLGPFIHFVPPSDKHAIQWLRFKYQPNYSRVTKNSQSGEWIPIEDFYAYNQSLARNLNPMDEVFVEMDARISEGGLLVWRFDHRGTIYEFQIDTASLELRVGCHEDSFPEITIPIEAQMLAETDTQIEFSSFDLQLLVRVNEKTVFRRAIEESGDPVSVQPLIFGAAQKQITFNRIRIWRDLYYFPSVVPQDTDLSLDSQPGYFVIGDNVPISVDSRHWRSPLLLRPNILGKVIMQ